MKVTFKLEKHTLDITRAINQLKESPDTVMEVSYDVPESDPYKAFDHAATLFAQNWLNVEYSDS